LLPGQNFIGYGLNSFAVVQLTGAAFNRSFMLSLAYWPLWPDRLLALSEIAFGVTTTQLGRNCYGIA
jgi:hypothetical protein